jgi:hypothetical protein
MKYLLALALLASPLQGQIWLGDTAAVREQRQTRGFFYVDTTETIGWRKLNPRLPWIGEINPPLEYSFWWMETASCQGLPYVRAQYSKYRFFFINSEIFGNRGPFQVGYIGYTLPDSAAIYLALPHIKNKRLLMHEVTHALQALNGFPPGHPPRFFGKFGCGFDYGT